MTSLVACFGKKAYLNFELAMKAIKNMNKERGMGKLRPYKCDCGKWHIGSGERPK